MALFNQCLAACDQVNEMLLIIVDFLDPLTAILVDSITYHEGDGSWASYSNNSNNSNNKNKPWKGRMDLTVLHLWYGKVQAGLTPTSTSKTEEEEEKGWFSLARAGLSSYLCRLCTMCVNLSMLRVVSTPPHYLHKYTSG